MIPKDITKRIAESTSTMLIRYASTIPDPNKTYVSFGERELTLQNVEEDPHVSSCIQQRKAGALSLEFEIQYDETNQHLQDVFESVLENLDVHASIDKFLDALLYGFCVQEIDWDYKEWNGQHLLLPVKLISKPREWFKFDANKVLRLNDIESTLLPRYKYLLVQHGATSTNPYGKSLLSKCLWPVVFKKADITFWMMFAEVYGMPKFVGKTDASRGTDQFEEFFDDLEGLIQDGKILIPNTDSIEGLNPATATNVDVYDKMIDKMNSEISKIWLSETLTTEIGKVGSYAASDTHADVRKLVTMFDARMAEKTFRELFKWIKNFNFPDINVPRFIMYEAQDVDRPLAEVVQILESNKNIKFRKKFYQDRFGFKEDEFDIVETPATPSAPFSASQHSHEHNHAVSDTIWDQLLIDKIGDKLLEDEEVANSLKNSLSDFLDKHNDYETAIKGIAKLLPDMPSNGIEEILTNALFIADVTGRLSVQEEVENEK